MYMTASKSHKVLQLHDYLKYFTARGEALFECNECGHLTVQLLKLIVALRTSQQSIHKNVRYASTALTAPQFTIAN